MQAVARLCSRCIYLYDGRVQLDGSAVQVSNAYLNAGIVTSAMREWDKAKDAPGNEIVRLRAVRAVNKELGVVESIDIRSSVGIEIEYEVLVPRRTLMPVFELYNEAGVKLFVSVDLDPPWRCQARPVGRFVSTGWIPGNLLAEGMVSVGVSLLSLDPEELHFEIADAVTFRVVDSMSARDTARGDYGKPIPGMLRPLLKWCTRYSA
jgi:lipopolysaccharide transport system ATP-binding protein